MQVDLHGYSTFEVCCRADRCMCKEHIGFHVHGLCQVWEGLTLDLIIPTHVGSMGVSILIPALGENQVEFHAHDRILRTVSIVLDRTDRGTFLKEIMVCVMNPAESDQYLHQCHPTRVYFDVNPDVVNHDNSLPIELSPVIDNEDPYGERDVLAPPEGLGDLYEDY